MIVDGRLSWRGNGFEFYIGATNLLNAEYRDFGNIPMPRRWIVGGLTVDLARPSSTSKSDRPVLSPMSRSFRPISPEVSQQSIALR
ncbi:MAG: hypothetical protein SCM96_02100 [Acidobacteriota bacterium]|nr:hypothetical protein [Acidobacteriota bacterium]